MSIYYYVLIGIILVLWMLFFLLGVYQKKLLEVKVEENRFQFLGKDGTPELVSDSSLPDSSEII